MFLTIPYLAHMSGITYKEKMKYITTIIVDFDGVLTNGTVFLMPPHDFVRTMNVRDSFAIQHAVKMGFRFAVITGGNNEVVKERMKYLGVTDVFLRSADKLTVYEQYKIDNNLEDREILYMGDDLPDFPVLKTVGISTCPYDAADEIKGIVDYISIKRGGEGCVRDVIEQVLKIHGKWFSDEAFKW